MVYARAEPAVQFHGSHLSQGNNLDSSLYFEGLSGAFFICRALPPCFLRFQRQAGWLSTS
jgi:hypothetical protein